MRAIDGGAARRIATYAACVAGCLGVGALSATVGHDDGGYATLHKPGWTPPAFVFPIVWTLLYATMGLALAGVLTKAARAGKPRAIAWFAAQLAASALWSVLFFRWHSIGGGLINAIALWLLIGTTIAAFWSVRDWTGALLLPYWAWVTFAVALNAAVWRLNS